MRVVVGKGVLPQSQHIAPPRHRADVMDEFYKLFFFHAVVIEFDINVFGAVAAVAAAVAAVTVRPSHDGL